MNGTDRCRRPANPDSTSRGPRRWTLAALAAVLFAAGAPAAAGAGSDDQSRRPQGWQEVEARKKADVAAQLLTASLMTELGAALEKGGPVEAMRVCSESAQRVTEELSQREGIVVRRTALRLRNRANRPDEFERAWLTRAEVAVAEGRAPEPVYEVVDRAGDGKELRHLRPILFPGGICSQCHGSAAEIGPEVKALLRQRYPDDRATGFAPGQLRGAISVRVLLGD